MFFRQINTKVSSSSRVFYFIFWDSPDSLIQEEGSDKSHIANKEVGGWDWYRDDNKLSFKLQLIR